MRGRLIVITGRRSKQVAALMKVLPDGVALGMVARQTKTFRAK